MRLLLARTPDHPLAEAVREAGWEPVPFFSTRHEVLEGLPPIPLEGVAAVVVLSPAGALAVRDRLRPGILVLATGDGTARALAGLDVDIAPEPRAEALWELLQRRLPEGGELLVVRAERGRDYLARMCEGSPWRLHPWITHREVPVEPLEPLPEAEALLALGPLQAECLGPRAEGRLRLAWGERTAAAFAASGYPAHGTCEPRPEALRALLTRILPGG